MTAINDMYIFRRGKAWSCRVLVSQDVLKFYDIVTPPNADPKLVERFLEEAEKATYKQVDEHAD